MAKDKGSSNPKPVGRERDLIDAARRQVQPRTAGNAPGSGGLNSDDSNAPTFSDAASTPIPGYEILREIHRGGQGVVYQALQKSTQRKVAIKVMREGPFAGPRDLARFEREVRVLGQLNHPNIVAIHDSGSASGRFYLVMDYISGRSLDAHVGDSRGSSSARTEVRGSFVEQTLRLGAKICEAVHAAHLRGITHRDLKPANIRVDVRGEPHILDFGLAKMSGGEVTDEPHPRVMSQTGVFIGSLPWASPEQARGDHDRIDLRTDVYSLGVVLYQMLTGGFPYPVTGSLPEVLGHITHTEPDHPSRIKSLPQRIDDEVETILLKCLNKEPERRYQSAGEVARDIHRYLAGEPIEAKRDTPLANWYMLRKSLRRYRVPAAIAAAFGILVVVFAVAMTLMYQRATRQAHINEKLVVYLKDTLGAIDPDVVKGANPRALLAVLDERIFGAEADFADHPLALATVRDVAGMLYLKLAAYDVAGKLVRAALETRRDSLGDEHPATAESLNHLAQCFIDAKTDYKAAAAYSREALDVRRLLLLRGESDEADVAESLNTLAVALRKKGRSVEAEPLYREALDIRLRLYGHEHVDVAGTQNDLALALDDLTRFDEAEELLRLALATRRKVLGDLDTRVATVMANLGGVLRHQGRVDEAIEILRESLDIRKDLLGESNNQTIVSMNKLVLALTDHGQLDEAEELARHALQLRVKLFGDQHEHVAVSWHNLALVLVDQQNYDEALACCRSALDIQTEVLPDGDWHLDNTGSLMGACWAALGRDDQAEPLLVGSFEALRDSRGLSNRHTVESLERIVIYYEDREDWQAAARYEAMLPAPPPMEQP